MSDIKYCTHCGTQKQTVETSRYNENTGKKVLAQVCPKVGCTKNCDFYGCEYTEYFFKTNRCKKCGEIPYSECY